MLARKHKKDFNVPVYAFTYKHIETHVYAHLDTCKRRFNEGHLTRMDHSEKQPQG